MQYLSRSLLYKTRVSLGLTLIPFFRMFSLTLFKAILIAILVVFLSQRLRCTAITGGIGSGKSTAVQFIRDTFPSVATFDCDEAARLALAKGSPAYSVVVKAFGPQVLTSPNQEIDRKSLSTLIFNDANKRHALNAIVHPGVFFAMFKTMFIEGLVKGRRVLVDIPLLFESPWYIQGLFYPRILIACTQETQIKRVMKRNKDSTAEEVQKRLHAQMSLSDKMLLADFAVPNEEDVQYMQDKLLTIWSITG